MDRQDLNNRLGAAEDQIAELEYQRDAAQKASKQAAAEATGSPTPLAAKALSFYQQVVDQGDGDLGLRPTERSLGHAPPAGQRRVRTARFASPNRL